jgi:hypothetical protein
MIYGEEQEEGIGYLTFLCTTSVIVVIYSETINLEIASCIVRMNCNFDSL